MYRRRILISCPELHHNVGTKIEHPGTFRALHLTSPPHRDFTVWDLLTDAVLRLVSWGRSDLLDSWKHTQLQDDTETSPPCVCVLCLNAFKCPHTDDKQVSKPLTVWSFYGLQTHPVTLTPTQTLTLVLRFEVKPSLLVWFCLKHWTVFTHYVCVRKLTAWTCTYIHYTGLL